MDEQKEFRAWCESLTESDWLIAQSFEESFFLGAWAAWRHLRAALATANERAEAAERAADRNRERTEDIKTAYRVAIARADALAVRLAEVDDREHPR